MARDCRQIRDITKYMSIGRGRQTDRRTKNDQERVEWLQWLVPIFGVAAATAIAIHTKFSRNGRGSVRLNSVEAEGSQFDVKQINQSLVPKHCLLVKSKCICIKRMDGLECLFKGINNREQWKVKGAYLIWSRSICHLLQRNLTWKSRVCNCITETGT